MIFEYVHGDNSREIVDLSSNWTPKEDFITIDSSSKLAFIKEFTPAYKAGQKMVLFDKNHKQLLAFHEENDINALPNADKLAQDTQLLFFTSGSTGFPVGAFKTRENLLQEVEVLKALVLKKRDKQSSRYRSLCSHIWHFSGTASTYEFRRRDSYS